MALDSALQLKMDYMSEDYASCEKEFLTFTGLSLESAPWERSR